MPLASPMHRRRGRLDTTEKERLFTFFPGFESLRPECSVKDPYGMERETWLPVTSDSFRLFSNQLIFKTTPRRQARASSWVTDGELERLFSLLVF
jgi:hypothetical protein